MIAFLGQALRGKMMTNMVCPTILFVLREATENPIQNLSVNLSKYMQQVM
jgi:hypothetical protein